MGWALVKKSDGRLDGGWFRYDHHTGYNTDTHEEVESAEPPGEFDFWNGSAFVSLSQQQIAALPEQVAKANEASICTHLDAEIQALKQFRTGGATWASLTSNQKDALIARLLRDVEYLCRIVRRKLNET